MTIGSQIPWGVDSQGKLVTERSAAGQASTEAWDKWLAALQRSAAASFEKDAAEMDAKTARLKQPLPPPIPWYQHPDPAVGKSQVIRLVDIFVLAPAMIYAGLSGRLPASWRKWAVIGGLLTAIYNAQNFVRVRRTEAIPFGRVTTFALFRLDEVGFEMANSTDVADRAVHRIAKSAGLTILEKRTNRFPKQGLTVLAILAESHLAIHTEPESNKVEVTLQTCGKFDRSTFRAILADLRAEYLPTSIAYKVVRSNELMRV